MSDNIQNKWFLADMESRVLRVAFELSDDPNYTKEMAIEELEKIAEIINEGR